MTVHRDVAVGAIGSALTATDAVIFDDDFLVPLTKNGVYGTADEAVGVCARAAAGRNEEVLEPQSFSDQASFSSVRIGAGSGALIAAGAGFEVEHQQALSIVETLCDEARFGCIFARIAMQVPFQQLTGAVDQCFLEGRVARSNFGELSGSDTYQFDVIESGAR